MKHFLRKLLLYAGVMFIALNAVLYVFVNRNPAYFLTNLHDYAIIKNSYALIHSNPESSNVIIGDSRGVASLIPSQLGSKYINLSVPGINFWEGYMILKRRLGFAKIDTLLLVYGIGFYEENMWTERRTVPLQFPQPSELAQLSKTEWQYKQVINEKYKISGASLALKQAGRYLRYFRVPVSYLSTFKESFPDYYYDTQPMYDLDSINIHKGYTSFGNKDSVNIAIEDPSPSSNFQPNPVNMAYLDSIIVLSKQHNISLRIIVPPINKATYTLYERSVYFVTASAYLKNNFGHYLLNEINFLPNSCFGDPTHLNKNGAILFTKITRDSLYGLAGKGKYSNSSSH